MKRTVLVSILAVAALALLGAFAYQSRSLPPEIHVARHTAATEVQAALDNFDALLTGLDSAWRNAEPPSADVPDLRERLAASPERLAPEVVRIPGSGSELGRITNSLERLRVAVAAADELAGELIVEQAEYANALAFLRDVGPRLIQQMRDIALDRVATDAFQLIAGTVDYAVPESTTQEASLRRLLTMLNRDQRLDANMPTEMDRLLGSVTTILNTKSTIRSKLAQLHQTPVLESAESLGQAIQQSYDSAVAAESSARTMLAIYATVLFVAVGFVGFRLQHSYGQINRANTELATLNESLEQRVEERTRELTTALSELKESQVQLVQAEKMSSLGQLVAGISHEINTPLLYLANNASLMKERIELLDEYIKQSAVAFSLDKSSFDDRAEYQTQFIGALKKLKTMLREEELEAALEETRDLMNDNIEGLADLTEMAQSLKDFSRLDRAPVGKFDVNGGLDKTLTIARNIVKHKAEVHKFYGDVPEIECSPSKINQVFLNLITNAAQAIDERGEIVITTKQRGDDRVAVSICDSGCGITPENLSKIRDPFFTTKEVGSGTGLGLSIVDEIIRSHGGELEVESKPGAGSTFTVVLPVTQPRSVAAESAEDETEVYQDFIETETDLAEAV